MHIKTAVFAARGITGWAWLKFHLTETSKGNSGKCNYRFGVKIIIKPLCSKAGARSVAKKIGKIKDVGAWVSHDSRRGAPPDNFGFYWTVISLWTTQQNEVTFYVTHVITITAENDFRFEVVYFHAGGFTGHRSNGETGICATWKSSGAVAREFTLKSVGRIVLRPL